MFVYVWTDAGNNELHAFSFYKKIECVQMFSHFVMMSLLLY